MIVLLSGEIASGKSTLTKVLMNDYRFAKISTGQFLIETATARGLSPDRSVLQTLGDQLDAETGGDGLPMLPNFRLMRRKKNLSGYSIVSGEIIRLRNSKTSFPKRLFMYIFFVRRLPYRHDLKRVRRMI